MAKTTLYGLRYPNGRYVGLVDSYPYSVEFLYQAWLLPKDREGELNALRREYPNFRKIKITCEVQDARKD